MPGQNHIIGRQVLEVQVPSVDEAWRVQNRISELYKQELLPVLEDVFDSLCPNGEVIRIDRLEIELGRLREQDFEEQVRQKLRSYLLDTFVPLVKQELITEKRSSADERFSGKKEHKRPEQQNKPVIKRSEPAGSRLKLVLHFLQTGTAPWWYDKASFGEIREVMKDLVKHSTAFIQKLSFLIQRPGVIERLVFTLEDEILELIILQSVPGKNSAGLGTYKQLIAASRHLFKEGMPLRTLRNRIWETAIAHLVLRRSEAVHDFFTLHTLRPDAVIPEEIRTLLLPQKEEEEEVKGEKRSELPVEPGIETEAPDPDLEVEEEDIADHYITNAGMVLLWPFLQPFFGELGLLNERKFIDTAAAHRAVHLLQYLAGGDTTYEEHELVLNKILCGLDPADPVDMEMTLSEKEKEECEHLLSSAIDNWKAIGKISTAGFRFTFLVKEGALRKAENGWNLFIERKTVDMLLDRLPWGISIVKFPWSKEMIYTEW